MTVDGTYPHQIEDLDPLASFTAPPKNETKMERFMREQQELFAKRTSDRIDEHLNGEKAKAASSGPARKQVRVLVLGHRASGMLTLLSWKLKVNVVPIRKVDHYKAFVNDES